MTPDTLAAIVARDAEWVEEPNGSLAYTWINARSGQRMVAPHATDPDGPADRRALLALLRDTRDALAIIAENDIDAAYGRSAIVVRRRDIAAWALRSLAALDPEPPV